MFLIRAAFISMVFLVCMVSCSSEPDGNKSLPAERVTVNVQLKWQHSAQFAGLYLAKDMGYYRDENLDVRFIQGGPDIDQVDQLLEGNSEFALIPAESLFLKNMDMRMKAIAVIYQRSPLVFAVNRSSNIRSPQDFAGKTIAVGDMEKGGFLEGIIQFNALTRRLNISTDNVTYVPYDWSFKGFVEGSIDITPTYMTSGFIKLKYLGVDAEMIWPGDYDLEFYADTLVTRSDYIDGNKETVLGFLRASLRGWREAIADPDKAVEHTLAYMDEKVRDKQVEIMDAQAPLVHTGVNPIGWMQKKRWIEMHDVLVEQGIIDAQAIQLDQIYDMNFLNHIYGDNKKE